ncbi:MAG: RQC domain-containing protein, partial [Elusimicrobiota bacterium]|nr:RQC domain-containing protein [Elusimicrobiota bacterium]
SDYYTWKHLLADSPKKDIMLEKLNRVYNYCHNPLCRHRYIAEYFGQHIEDENCSACDYCLGELKKVDESLKIAEIILSCVSEVHPSFGTTHIADILAGSKNKKIRSRNHDRLSAYGKLDDKSSYFIKNMIDQLLAGRYLAKEGEYPVLKVTPSGREVLKGKDIPSLIKPVKKKTKKKKTRDKLTGRENIDKELYDIMREKRREIAERKGIPAYIVFHNRTLKEMASSKPLTGENLLRINGIGSVKMSKYGNIFLNIIKKYCRENNKDGSPGY